jgi:hypothetical protein
VKSTPPAPRSAKSGHSTSPLDGSADANKSTSDATINDHLGFFVEVDMHMRLCGLKRPAAVDLESLEYIGMIEIIYET